MRYAYRLCREYTAASSDLVIFLSFDKSFSEFSQLGTKFIVLQNNSLEEFEVTSHILWL